jgi:hypothetical protein
LGETFRLFFVRRLFQQFADEHVQVARRRQSPGQDLGAAAQTLEPALVELPAEGAQCHFQPAERHPQLVQAFFGTAHAQGGGIGGDLRQAIRQGGAERFLGPHRRRHIGGDRLDRLSQAQIAAGEEMDGGAGIVHGLGA